MPKQKKFVNVRYSLTPDEHEQMKRIQLNYERKFRINKFAQVDVLRHMMNDIEALQSAADTMKQLAAR